jgi:ankyrin repeat protein
VRRAERAASIFAEAAARGEAAGGRQKLDVGDAEDFWPKLHLDQAANMEAAAVVPRPGQPLISVGQMREVLAHFGVDINDVDESEYAVLHYAAMDGKTSLVAGLLAAGSDVDQRVEGRGLTPLHLAGGAGHAGVIRQLLSHGADINSVDSNGQTPLHGMMGCACEESVRMLLKAGADVHRADRWGDTPLHYAARSNEAVTTRLLLEAGADPNGADDQGWTALHHAVYRRPNAFGGEEIIQCLIKAGGDVNRVDEQGRSPLDNAVLYGRRSCLWILLRAGATVDMAKLLLEVQPDAFTDANKYAREFPSPGIPTDGGDSETKLRIFKQESSHISSAFRYVDKLAAAGGYENLVRTYRQVLTAPRRGCVTRYLRQRFGRDAPHDVAVLVLEFWKPPGGP